MPVIGPAECGIEWPRGFNSGILERRIDDQVVDAQALKWQLRLSKSAEKGQLSAVHFRRGR